MNHPHGAIVGFQIDLIRLFSHVGPDWMIVDFIVRNPVRDHSWRLIWIAVTLGDTSEQITVDRGAPRGGHVRHGVHATLRFRML